MVCDNLSHPAPLRREQLGLESQARWTARPFQHREGHRVRKRRPLAAPRPVRPVHVHARRIPLSGRSEEHTSELQSLMRISYAVFCLKKKNKKNKTQTYQANITQSSQITSIQKAT